MTRLVAHRAVFGERQNAHDLLAVSGDRDLFRRLSAIEVDLPGDVPAGTKWEPFVRGWRSSEHYFFAQTAPDLNAKRPGMVRTQILAFQSVDVALITDLEPLFLDLSTAWHESQLSAFALYIDMAPAGSTTPPTDDVIAAAEIVADGTANSTPGAFIGQTEFPRIVRDLWKRLPSEFRPDLSFGFSLTPPDLQHRTLHLVTVPTALADRWRNYPRRLTGVLPAPPSAAAAYLLSVPSAESVRDFVIAAGLPNPELANLPAYVRTAHYWKERSNLDLSGWVALAKDFALLAPSASVGATIKAEIGHRIVDLISHAQPNEVLSLRNLPPEPFGTAREKIATAITAWMAKRLNAVPAAKPDLLEVLQAWQRRASELWLSSISAALRIVCAKASPSVAANVWLLWQREESLLQPISNFIPSAASEEHCWSDKTPSSLTTTLSSQLLPWCRHRSWWSCHARVLLASRPWSTAIREQLAADPRREAEKDIRFLLAATDDTTAIDFCVTQNDTRLRQCATDLCLRTPELWARFSGALPGWRGVLERACDQDRHFLDRTKHGREIAFSLFDALLAGVQVQEVLWQRLGATRFADLSGYAHWNNALASLPDSVRTSFILATARGWLGRFFREFSKAAVLPAEIRTAVFGPSLAGQRFASSTPNLVSGGIALLTTFSEASEGICNEWLESIAVAPQRMTADQVAELIKVLKRRGWERSALTAKHLAERTHHADLWAVWNGYWETLVWQDKILLRLSDVFDRSPTPTTTAHQLSMRPKEKTAVFITALNLEFDAVCAHLVSITKKALDGTIYAVGLFTYRQKHCKVVVALAGMGNAEASLATERAIRGFLPDYAFFVGIAGGLKKDLRLGDVVAADKVYAYESGKALQQFQSRPKAPATSYAATQMANAVAREGRWLQRIKLVPPEPPKAYVKPIAAGEKVVDSHESEAFKLIAERYGDAYAVAMEDFGFVVAAHASPAVTFAAVRGISDFAREKTEAEKKNSQEHAAANATAFAFEMLAGYLETDVETEPSEIAPHLR